MHSPGESLESEELPVEKIAELCLKKFKSLPKTGKPTASEWTVLSGIVQHDSSNNCTKVVALGAGTKCIGQKQMCSQGLILNDSHAEVLARRALLRYFYRKMQLATDELQTKNPFVWREEQRVYALRSGVSFHFFSTQTPCGDACIVDTGEVSEHLKSEGDSLPDLPRKRLKLGEDKNFANTSLLTATEGTVFTGAKLIGKTHSDPMQQTVGAVRLKPGRGDRTLSISCSDKLSKWQLLGIQGALVDALLEQPIYIDTLNFCCQSRCASIERAICDRWSTKEFKCERFKFLRPRIRYCPSTFEFQQVLERQPSPNGLVWCDIEDELKPYEVSVNGKRQGVTNKKLHTPQGALKVSKYFLLRDFTNLLKSKQELIAKLGLNDTDLEKVSYAQYKNLATDYQAAWLTAKQDYFEQWTEKPKELLNFSIEKVEIKEKFYVGF